MEGHLHLIFFSLLIIHGAVKSDQVQVDLIPGFSTKSPEFVLETTLFDNDTGIDATSAFLVEDDVLIPVTDEGYSMEDFTWVNTTPQDNDQETTDVHAVDDDDGTSSTWRWQSVSWTWVMILKMTTALLGIVGNLVVILVLFTRRSGSRPTDVLIGALAAADFLTSIIMIPVPTPVRVPSTWTGEFYCKVVSTNFLMWIAIDASIHTLTIIPMERYFAISYPLRYRHAVTRERVIRAIFVIWFVAVILNVFLPVVAQVVDNRCVEIFPSHGTQLLIGFTLYILMFLIPTFIMLISQAQTAFVLHRQSRLYLGDGSNNKQGNPSAMHLAAKKRVLQMLFFVVAVFIVCWGTSQTAYLAYNLRLLPISYLYSPLYNVITVGAFFNSCANPIIYALRNPAFRTAIKELFTMSATTSKVSIFSEKLVGKSEISSDQQVA